MDVGPIAALAKRAFQEYLREQAHPSRSSRRGRSPFRGVSRDLQSLRRWPKSEAEPDASFCSNFSDPSGFVQRFSI